MPQQFPGTIFLSSEVFNTNLIDLRQSLPKFARKTSSEGVKLCKGIQGCTHDLLSLSEDWLANILGGIWGGFFGGFLGGFLPGFLLAVLLPNKKTPKNPRQNPHRHPHPKIRTPKSAPNNSHQNIHTQKSAPKKSAKKNANTKNPHGLGTQRGSSRHLPIRHFAITLGKDLQRAP